MSLSAKRLSILGAAAFDGLILPEVSMRKLLPWAVAGLICCLVAPAFSQSILVWDKDHNKLFLDPETSVSVDATYGIKKALDANDYTYDVSLTLPADLSAYQIIFVIMGTYC
jgi:hypothetical protein